MKKLRTTSFVLFISITFSLFSQELGTYQRIEGGINGFGLSFETPLAKQLLLDLAVGVGPSYGIENEYGIISSMNYEWVFFNPSLHASAYLKLMYNRNKRLKDKKPLHLNAGNYIGAKAKFVSSSSGVYASTNTILLNLNWGTQRTIGKHWLVSYSVGLGYGYNLDAKYGEFYPALDVKVGYVLPFFSKRR